MAKLLQALHIIAYLFSKHAYALNGLNQGLMTAAAFRFEHFHTQRFHSTSRSVEQRIICAATGVPQAKLCEILSFDLGF